MTPALAHKVETPVSQQEPQKRQPLCQGTYLAKDAGGCQLEVEVVSVRCGKKRILSVADFGGEGVHVPALETDLDFFYLVSRKGPLLVDLGHY